MPPVCLVHWLETIDYEQAWRLQEALAGEIGGGDRPPTLLLLEHPHTFTFGRRGQAENLLWDADQLSQRGVRVHWVDRGGDVTYHGPGQLVGYPLLPLASGGMSAQPGHPPQIDYIGYLRWLEAMLIEALRELGVAGERLPGLTGVWAQPGSAKLASIGVKVDARGVSRHGFALNVDQDMRYWEGIVACGIRDYASTSLTGLLDPIPTMDQVVQAVTHAFGETFGYEMVTRPMEWPGGMETNTND